MNVEIPEPGYHVGDVVVALIDHQLRYAVIEQALMDTRLLVEGLNVVFATPPRWEYRVRVLADPVEDSEYMVIAERTILKLASNEQADDESA